MLEARLMSRDLTLVDRQQLRQYYGARRGRAEGWEEEFARLLEQALANLSRQRQADVAASEALDAEILALWPSFDPVDADHFDALLEQRRSIPSRVLNMAIVAIEKTRREQREEERRERQVEFAKQQDRPPRERSGLRAHYDPFIALWRRGWGDSIYD
jgi:hypothetical protein